MKEEGRRKKEEVLRWGYKTPPTQNGRSVEVGY
jgi:hypothetical protein